MELDILKKAHAIHPIYAYQAEYSFITRGIEDKILPFCKEHDIRFIANAPLARGLLTDSTSHLNLLKDGDIRHLFPRLSLLSALEYF